ncbi:MAG TPA: hypothetical protein VGM53_14125 [Streptosporangiaceae bacterium]
MATHIAVACMSSPAWLAKVVVRSAQRGPVPVQNVRSVTRSPRTG